MSYCASACHALNDPAYGRSIDRQTGSSEDSLAAKALSSLFAIALLPACAHSTSSESSNTAKDTAATSTVTTQEQRNQRAKQIGERFLKLIEEISSRSEITVEKIEEVMQVRLQGDAQNKNFGARKDLGDGWSYMISFIAESSSLKPGYGLDFYKSGERSPDMSSVCSLDFSHYHNALRRMGYIDYPKYGEIGDLRAWIYRKDDIVISIIPEVKYFESEKRMAPTCVRSIATLN